MNYLSLVTLCPTYIFEIIFNKYNIPLELVIIIFNNLEKKDLFNFYKNFTVSIEIQCIFNKKIIEQLNYDKVTLQNKINLTKTKINSLCFSCKSQESRELLLILITEYNTYEQINEQKINRFFSIRDRFYKKMMGAGRAPSFILKYYECVNDFNHSEIIKQRRERYIKCKFNPEFPYYIKHNPTITVSYDRCKKKDLFGILDTNQIKYYKSWNKTRLVNAYYKGN